MKANIKELLNKVNIFLLDLDGTVYLGKEPIGDMINTLSKLRKSNKKIVYFTNNSSLAVNEYKQKLKRLGLFDSRDFVYTSSLVTIKYLKENFADSSVYLLGTNKLKKEFIDSGINIVEENPKVCVLAYDTTINFEKIKKFNEFLVEGKTYIATHQDSVCPTEGISMPDVGSFVEMFKCSSGRNPDIVIGKPNTIMGEIIARDFGEQSEKIAMVGDRLYTDIRFANNCSFNSVLVLSGETSMEQSKKSKDKPKYILNSLNDLKDFL